MSHYVDRAELRQELLWTNYQRACQDAATRQGLDPIMARLATEGIDAFVEQTGGFVMVATTIDGRYGITHDGDGPEEYILGVYDHRGDNIGCYIDVTLDVAIALIKGGDVYPIEDGRTLVDGQPVRFLV